jgi:nucleotide-binding universal stress UspA family protein
MSVAEVWLPPPPEGMDISQYAHDLQTHPQPFTAWQTHATEISGAEESAKEAADQLRSMFPQWKVTSEGTYGSPAWEILSKATETKADLIVVGSHGRSVVGRFFLGSISQKVLTEAECSVRIARGKVEVDPSPAQIVIGFDGSGGAHAAVDAVASRCWPKDSEIKLIAVTDLEVSSAMKATTSDVNWIGERDWLLELAADAISKLREAGLATEFVAEEGNPKNVLVDFAEKWHADAIFVGANRYGSRVERFLLGSVSAAVAARAHCSVEVVRKRT